MKRLAVVVSALTLVSTGCVPPAVRALFGHGWRAPAVPEVDSYVVDLQSLGHASTPEDVQALLGEPPFEFDLNINGEFFHREWRYPIRSITLALPPGAKGQERVVPAVVLRIRLDAAGRVAEWGFFHPVTGARLEIRQSLAEADALFRRLCNPPRRIELEAALRPGTTKDEVLTRMRWFAGTLSTAHEQAQYRSIEEDPGETLIYYADHPSPIYVPPEYVVVTFGRTPEVGTHWTFEATFGGCYDLL